MKKSIALMLVAFSMVLSTGVFASTPPPKEKLVPCYTITVVTPQIDAVASVDACNAISALLSVPFVSISNLRSTEFTLKRYQVPLKIGDAEKAFTYSFKPPLPTLSDKLIGCRYRIKRNNLMYNQLNRYMWQSSRC